MSPQPEIDPASTIYAAAGSWHCTTSDCQGSKQRCHAERRTPRNSGFRRRPGPTCVGTHQRCRASGKASACSECQLFGRLHLGRWHAKTCHELQSDLKLQPRAPCRKIAELLRLGPFHTSRLLFDSYCKVRKRWLERTRNASARLPAPFPAVRIQQLQLASPP